jgi:pimeloyl-ACP methyl ester carboxylesterase
LQPAFTTYKNSSIGYYRFGNGPKTAICFHGYGQQAGTFGFLENYAAHDFTFYAIDLPFHGSTKWNEREPFRWEDLRDIINSIILRHNLQSLNQDTKLTLIGFSLGGRVALSLYQAMPSQFEKVLLLAPDGLKINFWNRLATQTYLGNKLFYFTMKNPGWFFGFLKLVNKLGLVNASIFKFVKYYIDNNIVRTELYHRWTALRRLKPDLSKIKSEIGELQTAFYLIYGKHDRIILSATGEKFRKGIENYCTVEVIESGHQVLHENHISAIVEGLMI